MIWDVTTKVKMTKDSSPAPPDKDYTGGLHESKDIDILLHYLILGDSRLSYEKVIKTGKIKEIIKSRGLLLDDLACIRKTRRCVRQNSLLLCAGTHYVVRDDKRQIFDEKINDICNIPTDLFKMINIVSNDAHLNSNFEELENFKEFKEIMKNNPLKSKKEITKENSVDGISKEMEEANLNEKLDKTGEVNYSQLILKHKFIENWYLDPRKTATDMLYMLTKFRSRCGWDHKMILQHSHFKFKGNGLPVANKEEKDEERKIKKRKKRKEKKEKKEKEKEKKEKVSLLEESNNEGKDDGVGVLEESNSGEKYDGVGVFEESINEGKYGVSVLEESNNEGKDEDGDRLSKESSKEESDNNSKIMKEVGDINLVINYILHGTDNFVKKEDFKRYLEQTDPEYKGEGLDQITSRVLRAIFVLEKSKEGLKGAKKGQEFDATHICKVTDFIELSKREKGEPTSLYGKRNKDEQDNFSDDGDDEEPSLLTMACADGLGDILWNPNRDRSCPFVDAEENGPLGRFHFCVEHLPTPLYNYKQIWETLIQDLPTTALIRHICYMSHLGVFDGIFNENIDLLKKVLQCPKRLRQIHPFQILKVIMEYKQGGNKSRTKDKKRKWKVHDEIYETLCEAFYLNLGVNSNQNRPENPPNNPFASQCLESNLNYKVCIEASETMLKSDFIGYPLLSGTRAAVAMAHALQQCCDNTQIHLCRREPYLLDDKDNREKKNKKKRNKKQSDEPSKVKDLSQGQSDEQPIETDLHSRLVRIKLHSTEKSKEGATEPKKLHSNQKEGATDPNQSLPSNEKSQEGATEPKKLPSNEKSQEGATEPPKGVAPIVSNQKKKRSDLAQPITQAIERREPVDAFIIFTASDSSELMGKSPYDEFIRYQLEVNPNAKLIVCAMDVNSQVIADPNDKNVKVLCGVDGYLLREIILYMHPDPDATKDRCKFCCWEHSE